MNKKTWKTTWSKRKRRPGRPRNKRAKDRLELRIDRDLLREAKRVHGNMMMVSFHASVGQAVIQFLQWVISKGKSAEKRAIAQKSVRSVLKKRG